MVERRREQAAEGVEPRLPAAGRSGASSREKSRAFGELRRADGLIQGFLYSERSACSLWVYEPGLISGLGAGRSFSVSEDSSYLFARMPIVALSVHDGFIQLIKVADTVF